ncbi:MAG TPA: hypothetical protein VFB58_11745 [Chloroflexota bacterium]|nr:hypothetical protein [Chloroflexota bacterium]
MTPATDEGQIVGRVTLDKQFHGEVDATSWTLSRRWNPDRERVTT